MNATWSSPAHEAIGRLIRDRTGLVFRSNRVAEAEAGIRRAMGKIDLADASSYLQRLQRRTAELDELAAELTVAETYFFREPAQFEFIRTQVLPELMVTGSNDRGVRIWSCACASGEEAYSLAILVHEAGMADRAHVLATDISRRALVKARDASYGAWSFRGVDPIVVRRYFRAVGDRHVLDPRIRDVVHIERLNLAIDPYPSLANGTWRLDLILCRNVLMYFDQAVVRVVARKLWECLSPDGWLITGPSDPSINEEGLYESVVTRTGVFWRRRHIPDSAGPWSTRGDRAAMPEVSPPISIELESRPTTDTVAPEVVDRLAEAKTAMERGEYARAVELAGGLADAGATALCIRALANARGPNEAQQAALSASRRYPLAPEIHLLRSILLAGMARYEDAAEAAKKALYLDRTLAFGHFLLGMALSRAGDTAGARRSFHNARELLARQGPDEPVAFSEGQRAGHFAEAVTAQLGMLGGVAS